MMKGYFNKKESRGLPGGPNEQFTYVTGVFSQDMYHVPKAQEGWEQPIMYVDSEDDERNQLYQDSFQLYNASLAQKEVFGEGAWLPGGGVVNKTNTKGSLPENTSFAQTEAEYDTRNRLKNKTSKYLKNKELIKKYKNLGFTDESIKYYDVNPEVLHPAINPTSVYLPSPTTPRFVYEKPHTKVVVKPSMNSKKSLVKKKQPSYRVHDYMKMEDMDPSFDNRDMWARMLGIKDYKGTGEQNIELIKRLKEYKKNPIRAKYGGNISTEGYKRNSKDVNNPLNIIMGDPNGTPITMGGVDFAVKGVDNLGNEKIMYPEEEHHFPGSMVYETPYELQQGGSFNFNDLVNKYTTQGWASLNPQEQQFYRESYQRGGSIKLDPAKKGTFKALATRYGMSMDKLAMDMKKNPDKYSPGARKKANFYRNFAMQSGGEKAYETWERVTGKSWAEAKSQGLTDGTYKGNLALQQKLLQQSQQPTVQPAVQPIVKKQPQQNQQQSEYNFDNLTFNEAFGKAREMYGPNKIFRHKGHLKNTNRRGEPFEPSEEELTKWGMGTKKTKKKIKKVNEDIVSPYTVDERLEIEDVFEPSREWN